jgi:hypothetical protein
MNDEIEAAEKHLAEVKAKAAHKEYPKWIEPHPSHLDVAGDHKSVSQFPEHSVDRTGKVTVLVHDAAEEAKALAAKVVAAIKGDA